jgi:hypothetical protein
MDIIDKNKYDEFSNILSGCRTIIDACCFAENYLKTNPGIRQLVYSMVYGKRYEKVLDFQTMKTAINIIERIDNKDDAEETIDEYERVTTDVVQIITLKRIAKRKISNCANKNKNNIQIKSNKIKKLTKNCPHCGHNCLGDNDSEYVICGYSDPHVGYDWIGCGRDWCFKCNKMLCKKWKDDFLHILSNRIHNNDCCKKHANEFQKNYLNDYCQCNSLHIEDLIIFN